VSSPAGKEIIYWLVETPTNNLRTPTGAIQDQIAPSPLERAGVRSKNCGLSPEALAFYHPKP